MSNNFDTTNSNKNSSLVNSVSGISIQEILQFSNLSNLLTPGDVPGEVTVSELAKHLSSFSDFNDLNETLKELIEQIKFYQQLCTMPVVNLSSTVQSRTSCYARLDMIKVAHPNTSSPIPVCEDYVSIDTSSSKLIDITETITIPLGAKKIRMKTKDFVMLITAIVAAIPIITQTLFDHIDARYNNQVNQQLVEAYEEHSKLLREHNALLSELIDSADLSVSSKSKEIEELRSTVQDLNSEIQNLKDTLEEANLPDPTLNSHVQVQSEDHDDSPQIPDNTNEYLNTESEN